MPFCVYQPMASSIMRLLVDKHRMAKAIRGINVWYLTFLDFLYISYLYADGVDYSGGEVIGFRGTL